MIKKRHLAKKVPRSLKSLHTRWLFSWSGNFIEGENKLEQLYKFFACMVKPLCAGFIIPIFYMYDKAFDHGLYQNKSPQKVEWKTCKASIQKRWMWTCKIFTKYCEKYMTKEESLFKSSSLESLANVHVLQIVALFQKSLLIEWKVDRKNGQEVQKQSKNSWTGTQEIIRKQNSMNFIIAWTK